MKAKEALANNADLTPGKVRRKEERGLDRESQASTVLREFAQADRESLS